MFYPIYFFRSWSLRLFQKHSIPIWHKEKQVCTSLISILFLVRCLLSVIRRVWIMSSPLGVRGRATADSRAVILKRSMCVCHRTSAQVCVSSTARATGRNSSRRSFILFDQVSLFGNFAFGVLFPPRPFLWSDRSQSRLGITARLTLLKPTWNT